MPHYDYEVYLSSPYASADTSASIESVLTVQTHLPRDAEKPQEFADPAV